MQFHNGIQFEPSVNLARCLRYKSSKILGSRPWPFGVAWRHRPRDHWASDMRVPIGSPLKPSRYLASLLRKCVKHLAEHIPFENVWSRFVFGVSTFPTFCYSRSLGTSFKVLITIIGPRSLLLRRSGRPIEKCITGVNKLFTFVVVLQWLCVNFTQL